MTAEYKGWKIDFDPKPIPFRGFDYTAISPDFDADCDEDGYFVCAGQQVHAATMDDLMVEIDWAIMDMEEENVPH